VNESLNVRCVLGVLDQVALTVTRSPGWNGVRGTKLAPGAEA
jgi:hypothetical protein